MTTLDIVIPTYQRGEVLLATIRYLQAQQNSYQTLIVVDQSDYGANDTIAIQLQSLADNGVIQWLRGEQPSIPNAMNRGLLAATSDIVLFLDDDIIPSDCLVAEHLAAFQESSLVAVVGQILQPDEIAQTIDFYPVRSGFDADLQFPFYSDRIQSIQNCMAGNLSVNRQLAIDCGGFDTNFIGAAYRFETEFCRRLLRYSQLQCWFIPTASIRHLKVPAGGTRSKARNFLCSILPDHSVGEYYFILQEARGLARIHYLFRRYLSSLKARFYLSKPWWIPVRMIAEFRGFCRALALYKQGPKMIQHD